MSSTLFMSGNFDYDIKNLLNTLEKTQYTHRVNFDLIKNYAIMTRDDLRNTPMKKGLYQARTSGSTGEQVSVEKTYEELVWYSATSIREYRWRKWNVKKNLAVINILAKEQTNDSWSIPRIIEPIQGKSFINKYKTINELQQWLEEKNPHYLQARPSIVAELDLSKISNLIDHKGTGEVGGSMYSSEECGTIAIQCPDNQEVMHVMENIIVEAFNKEIVLTNLSNPYVKRYKHGDHVELTTCNCGRTLQTIKNIKGRIWNMFVLPDGNKKWPSLGSREYYHMFGIKKFKAIQTSLFEIELQLISEPLNDREQELIALVKRKLNEPNVNVSIKYVESFPNYKFEEFVSLVR